MKTEQDSPWIFSIAPLDPFHIKSRVWMILLLEKESGILGNNI